MAYRIVVIDYSFSFSVKKSGQALCCNIFFSEKKKKKLSFPLGQFNVDYIMHRCYRPECFQGILFKMATTAIVKKTIQGLKEVSSHYVKQKFRRNELLDFVSRDFSEYAWSLRALNRRLEFFNGTTLHTPILLLRSMRSKTQ